jgi:hypothetical protein
LGILEFLVEEHEADINQEQFTPLATAAANSKVDHISYLLSKGAGSISDQSTFLEAAALFSPKQSTFGEYDELISEFLLEIT